MATFNEFEDIQAWQKVRILVKRIYQITDEGDFSKDFDLRSQIRRSSVSVVANIAEGQGRRSDKKFAGFCIFHSVRLPKRNLTHTLHLI